MTNRNSQYWMWAEACELIGRTERLQRKFHQHGEWVPWKSSWEPAVDMFETEHALWLVVALPGVAAEQIELSISGSGLLVAGIRKLPPEVRASAIRCLEIPAGRFERLIELPGGRYDLIERRFADGCLTLGLRKQASSTALPRSRL